MLDRTTPSEAVIPASEPQYQPIWPVQCISFADDSTRRKNMAYAFKLNPPRLGTFEVPTEHKLHIVCGGPSLNQTYKNIPKDAHVMVCGTAHDHAVRLGIKPTYAIDCDPSLTQHKNYKEVPEGCIYLIASRCHRSLFTKLKGRHVRMWHMYEEQLGKPIYRGEPAYICGATIALSAIPVALSMTYNEFHFYGLDSSFKTFAEHHAYPMEENAQVMEVRVGDLKTGPLYTTTATWIGQAQQYQEMVKHWGHMFKATIHGDGMLAEMERQAGRQA